MRKRTKKWLKIATLVVTVLVCLLVAICLIINYLARVNLEAGLEAVLRADVSVDGVHVNMLSNSLTINDLCVRSDTSDAADTLLSVGAIRVQIDDFAAGVMTLKTVACHKLVVKNIVDEAGKNLWQSIVNEDVTADIEPQSDSLLAGQIFVGEILVDEAAFVSENRQTGSVTAVDNVNVSVHSTKNGAGIATIFNAGFNINNGVTVSLSGSSRYCDGNLQLVAGVQLPTCPLSLKLTHKRTATNIEISSDFTQNNGEEFASSGKITALIRSFTGSYGRRFNATLRADKFAFKDADTDFAADFRASLTYIDSFSHLLHFDLQDVDIQLNSRHLAGSFSGIVNDTALIVASDMHGRLAAAADTMTNFLVVDSDLGGLVSDRHNNLSGRTIVTAKFQPQPDVTSSLSTTYDKNGLHIDIDFSSNVIAGKQSYNLQNIHHLFTQQYVNQDVSTEIAFIRIPELTTTDFGLNLDIKDKVKNMPAISLPHNVKTLWLNKIDTIFIAGKQLCDIRSEIYSDSNRFSINDLGCKIGFGHISGKLDIITQNDSSIVCNVLNINHLDLPYLTDGAVSGYLDIWAKNHIPFIADTLLADKVDGFNQLKIDSMSIGQDILHDFTSDSNALKISNLDLILNIANGKIEVVPSHFVVNGSRILYKGNYDLQRDSLDVRILVNAPHEAALPSFSSLFSSTAEGESDSVANTLSQNVLVKIFGKSDDINYKVSKLRK